MPASSTKEEAVGVAAPSVFFAPFSEARLYVPPDAKPPYAVQQSQDEVPKLALATDAALLHDGDELHRARQELQTPHTARILRSTKATVSQGESSLAVAFSKSVQAIVSPRVVLAPQKPLSIKSPRHLAALPPARPAGSAVTAGDLPAHRPSVCIVPSANESIAKLEKRTGFKMRHLELFQGDKGWLLCPPKLADALPIEDATQILMTALPEKDHGAPDLALLEEARRKPSFHFRRGSALLSGAMFEVTDRAQAKRSSASRVAPPDSPRTRPQRPSAVSFTTPQAPQPPPVASLDSMMGHGSESDASSEFDEEEGHDAVRPLAPSFSLKPTPRRSFKRRESVMMRAKPSEIAKHLRGIKWFRELSTYQLQSIVRRAKHRMAPKYSTIIREGSIGTIFYVLLKGSVRVTNATSDLNVVVGAGCSFGEGALITAIKREATVTAIDACHLLQITSDAFVGLGVDLEELRCHIVANMLGNLRFFRAMALHRRELIAGLLQIEYYHVNDVIFEEGAPGDKLYILVEGRVGIYKNAGKPEAGAKPTSPPLSTGKGSPQSGRGSPTEATLAGATADAAVPADGTPAPGGRTSAGLNSFRKAIRKVIAINRVTLAHFSASDHYPWFGEMALVSHKKRAATAAAVEPLKLLTLDRANFGAFMQAIPTFIDMLEVSTSAYTTINKLEQANQASRREDEPLIRREDRFSIHIR